MGQGPELVFALLHGAEAALTLTGGAGIIVAQEAAPATRFGGVAPTGPAYVVGGGVDVALVAGEPSVAVASSRTFGVGASGAGVVAFVDGGFVAVAAEVAVGVGERVGRRRRGDVDLIAEGFPRVHGDEACLRVRGRGEFVDVPPTPPLHFSTAPPWQAPSRPLHQHDLLLLSLVNWTLLLPRRLPSVAWTSSPPLATCGP